MTRILENIDLVDRIELYLLIALALAGISIAIVLYILFKRVLIKLVNRRSLKARNEIRNSLNLMAAIALEKNINRHDLKENLFILQQYSYKSENLSQLMIDHLVDLCRNLSGKSAQVLRELYKTIQLYQLSRKKLMQGDLNLVIKGIHELAEMHRYEDKEYVIGFLHHFDKHVRLEARIALMRLNPDNPCAFLKEMKDPLSEWEIVLIYNRLHALTPDKVPDFKLYFDHMNGSVVRFSIEMAARFLQYDAINDIAAFIFHPEVSTCTSAIYALRLLEANGFADHILYLFVQTNSKKIKLACIDCLTQIADPNVMLQIYQKLLRYSLDFDIVRELSKGYVELNKGIISSKASQQFKNTSQLLISHYANNLIN